jgi:hypothetical protein
MHPHSLTPPPPLSSVMPCVHLLLPVSRAERTKRRSPRLDVLRAAQTVLFAEGCGHLNFDSRINMCVLSLAPSHLDTARCIAQTPPPSYLTLTLAGSYGRWQKALTNSAEFVCVSPPGAPVRWFTLCAKVRAPPSLHRRLCSCASLDRSPHGCIASPPDCTHIHPVWLQLLPAGILWGAGTAMGEIPPYFVSYSAAKLGSKVTRPATSSTVLRCHRMTTLQWD